MTLMELQRPINSPVLNLWDVRITHGTLVRQTVDQPAIQRWRSSAYRDPTAAHPLVDHRSPDGGPARWSGQPLENCQTIVATGPTVEPSWFQQCYDPIVKPPYDGGWRVWNYGQQWTNTPRSREVARWCTPPGQTAVRPTSSGSVGLTSGIGLVTADGLAL
ncbi:hypothetical protein PCASD_21420 [Puccinia coronata f. sp. avenae]|uniref:Uncharacterized protein n=1 Tax=Puccinia coronata f. sp. avenae TaxID=200324 RepID=A0A2N5SGM3_9BASI|nr:hypothetical protein PCASD_21420 [Puccinia coronata f. sp. avenae]